MAQRAYRQRKESTLDELRKRVSGLTNTIELMNKSFVDFRDRLTGAGLPDNNVLDLREVSEQYEALMKCVRNPAEECDPKVARLLHRASSGSDQGQDAIRPAAEPRNVPSWMDQNVVQSHARQRGTTEVGMGYTMYMQPAEDSPSNMSPSMDYFGNLDPMSHAMVPTTRASSANSPGMLRANAGAATLPPELGAPRSYSFQESTFGRRLHRACLEQGYQLLLDPSRRPATYERVFRLSLLNKNREKLIEAMRDMLNAGPQDSLDSRAPLIHIGGAGTHFPRRDQYGNIHPKKESWNLGVVGPQTVSLLETAAQNNLTTDMTVNIAGFEGEWFDPYDVEGYLHEKGIFIDPTSSFAEAEVLDSPSVPSNISTGTTMSAQSPRTPDVFGSKNDALLGFDTEQMEYLSSNDASVNEWMDFTPLGLTDVGYSDANTGSWMNFLQPGETMKMHGMGSADIVTSQPGWQAPTPRSDGFAHHTSALPKPPATFGHTLPQQKKTVIIDVAKFVKGERRSTVRRERADANIVTVMTASGQCIGRTPGFKRRDVDRALALSSFDAL